MSDMGERIRQKRTEKGMSLEELGKILGVQKTAVSKWEHGAVENLKRSTIEQMARIFGCSPAWLMGFDDAVKTEPSWMAAFSGVSKLDPRVVDFIAYLKEKDEQDSLDLTPTEIEIVKAYRNAEDSRKQLAAYALRLFELGDSLAPKNEDK